MGKKTGFLLANIHQGTSLSLWKTIAREALKRENSAFFVFPGGRLSYPEANEHLRNQVFSLANSRNIDKAIVWSSSLTGSLDYNQVGEFVQELDKEIPIVSLGLKIENIPSVDFDAYSGIFNEIDHLIKRHGCKKIAFIRGPKSHQSAEKRFQAYKDALEKNNLFYDSLLVSTPRSWSDGISSIKELMEERGLKAGIDFDSIVFSSDLMMFWASKYLENKGIAIPNTIKIVGFNDSDENALMTVAATTVKMPIKELAVSAYALSEELSKETEKKTVDIVLPTELILRNSCGCEDSFGGKENARKVISSWEGLRKWLSASADNTQATDEMYFFLKGVYDGTESLVSENKTRISTVLSNYFNNGGKYEYIFESIKWIEEFLTTKHLSKEERDILYSQMAYQRSRCNAYKGFISKRLISHVDRFKLELLATSTYILLAQKLKRFLPEIGVSKAFVCVHKNDNTTTLACGFSGDTIFHGGEEFPSELLIDSQYADELEKGLFVVQPLVYDNSYVGYLILETKCLEGNVLEDIRTAISTTLKGIELFTVASEKSRKAEEAERHLTGFYANFSEGLKEPLEAIRALSTSKDIDRNTLLAYIAQAEHLVGLSLAEIGEIQLECQFVPMKYLINEIRNYNIKVEADGDFPAINIDSKRIVEAFRILSDEVYRVSDIPNICVSIESTSISFLITGEKGLWNPAIVEKTPSLLFAEKIIVMHGGAFSFSSRSIRVSLLFPSLSGEVKTGTNLGQVLFIADNINDIPKSICNLDVALITQERLLQDFSIPPQCVALAMDLRLEGSPSAVLINLLKNHVSTKSLPFMLFGVEAISISLSTALEGSVPRLERATIFSFGSFPDTLSKLSEFGTVVEVSSLAQADEVEGNGSLAIFYEFNLDSFNKLRSSRKFNKTPILIVKDSFEMKEAEALAEIPNVIIVNPSITESEEFISKIVGIFGGGELLPPLTSVLVKKAIAYLNKHAYQQISRWQLAEAVNISEDYLTRIFRKEMGISPWDYLNRYRIQLACKLLTQTGLSINEIAQDTGFQDQAYFCRVFKKVKGFPPGHIRQRL